jgi:hypothetical protein
MDDQRRCACGHVNSAWAVSSNSRPQTFQSPVIGSSLASVSSAFDVASQVKTFTFEGRDARQIFDQHGLSPPGRALDAGQSVTAPADGQLVSCMHFVLKKYPNSLIAMLTHPRPLI